ncbi:hypothetical protein RB195_015870 [Necator americanus]|uniref:Reverse transcriptase domain-containing protein n=1 Tax=Necator americanus TaxID=51031 RepID=A0ABR1E6N5_NECAM
MRKLEWDDMGVKVDGRQLHHLRFGDDVVLITPSISQAERMLTEFDETCACIGLQLNLQKTMFIGHWRQRMGNGWVSDAPLRLNGTNMSECTSYVCLGRELKMMNDLTPELGRRRRAAWGAYKSNEDVVKKTRNIRLHSRLFNTVLPALTYVSETWAFRKQEENAANHTQGSTPYDSSRKPPWTQNLESSCLHRSLSEGVLRQPRSEEESSPQASCVSADGNWLSHLKVASNLRPFPPYLSASLVAFPYLRIVSM